MTVQRAGFQVLPSARIVPRLTVPKHCEDRLTIIASDAYRLAHGDPSAPDIEPLAVLFAVVRARSAAQFYVSEKAFESALPAFRKMLRDGELRKAMDTLRENLGTDAEVPFAQMRSLFCYGDPQSNGLQDAIPKEVKQHQEREDLWDAKFSTERFRELLEQWQTLMDELHGLTGVGRTPILAERGFVSALASYWASELECEVANAGQYAYSPEAKQARNFVSFVHTAAEIIPEEYRPSTWDHAIRAVRFGEN